MVEMVGPLLVPPYIHVWEIGVLFWPENAILQAIIDSESSFSPERSWLKHTQMSSWQGR